MISLRFSLFAFHCCLIVFSLACFASPLQSYQQNHSAEKEIFVNMEGSETGLVAYFVPYLGDIDGSINPDWFYFYEQLTQWHDNNSIPSSFSFYPDTMNSEQFNQIIADMYTSENIELIFKGDEEYEGQRIDLMPYSQVAQTFEELQDKFVTELDALGYTNIQLPISYNQMMLRFTETIRDAAHDVGFEIYLEHAVSEYGYIGMLPDFDITQYSVSLTTSGIPGPNEVFKDANEVIQEIYDFYNYNMIYINGVKVVPLLCHQQDFRISYDSNELDQDKWDIYTSLLLMARDDPNIQLLKAAEVYDLRHSLIRNFKLTDFEENDGWTATGAGEGKFEIGIPQPFSPNEACITECFGTGPSEDYSILGANCACTNLDGHMDPNSTLITNSLTSPIYDFSGCRNVTLELWRFMEIEGGDYDLCYCQYRNSPETAWVTLETYGDEEVDDDFWVKYVMDLSDIADGKTYFQLRFYCTSDSWYEGSGLCLDDIKLSWIVASDFTYDNRVDFMDYARFATRWLADSNSPAFNDSYDLSDNGLVDMADLSIFSFDWLWGLWSYEDPNLVLYLRMDEGYGTVTMDLSENSNNGTLVNDPCWTTGKIGSALVFDASNDYVEVNDAPSFDIANEITVTAWINPVDASNWGTIVSKFAHTPSYREDLYLVLYNNKLAAALAGPSGIPGQSWKPDVPIHTDRWTHVALTYDGYYMVLYKDGVNAATLPVIAPLMLADPSSDEPLYIGRNTEWGEYFNGIIDEVRIYNRALEPSEIEDIYLQRL